jgi:serine/threonine protein kinase
LFSVVRGLNFFHEHGVCIGDFSHSNILFSLKNCSVFFLDCDSFRLKGDTVFPQTETGNWGVAERYPDEAKATASSDVYKLGLLALRLLMKSDNPAHYQASTNTDRLPAYVDARVRAAIEDSLKEARNRPTLAKWSAVLHTAITKCVNESASQRAATTSSAKNTPASQAFNVFPTNTASRSEAASAPPPKPKVKVQYKEKPSANQPAQQPQSPNTQPQKKQNGGRLALASFVLSIGGWVFDLILLILNRAFSISFSIYFIDLISIIPLFIWGPFLLSFIFGLIGVRKSPRRGFAIAGLALSILPTVSLLQIPFGLL